jgi:DNA replication protein DnaC
MDLHYHLTNDLKRLRMPGMIENLDLRIKEATESNFGYLEFFQLLVQDEIASREANNLTKRLKAANLSNRCTFENFDFRFNERVLPPQTIRDLATCRFLTNNSNIILCGPPGIGKSHVVQAIGHEVCRRGSEAMFIKTHKLLDQLSDGEYPRRAARLWKRLRSVSALILDDFGFRRYATNEAELLYAICDERLGTGSIILTSNRPTEDWYSVFPDPVIGGAILDRLASPAIKLIIEKGRSYRKEGPKSAHLSDLTSSEDESP